MPEWAVGATEAMVIVGAGMADWAGAKMSFNGAQGAMGERLAQESHRVGVALRLTPTIH